MFVPQISVAILSCWQVCASGVRRRGKQAFANSANVQPKVFESPGPKVLRSIAFFCVAESELREIQSDLYIYNYIIHMCSHAVEIYIYIYLFIYYIDTCVYAHTLTCTCVMLCQPISTVETFCSFGRALTIEVSLVCLSHVPTIPRGR